MEAVAIPLTRGLVAWVDAADAELVSQYTWQATPDDKGRCYAVSNYWTGERYRTRRMHRIIMDAPTGMQVDHIDRDGLNNRRGNLRLATNGQNRANSVGWAASGYKGVIPNANGKRWVAQIRANHKQMYLGIFDNKEEAARAYDAAALKFHGEFARLNGV